MEIMWGLVYVKREPYLKQITVSSWGGEGEGGVVINCSTCSPSVKELNLLLIPLAGDALNIHFPAHTVSNSRCPQSSLTACLCSALNMYFKHLEKAHLLTVSPADAKLLYIATSTFQTFISNENGLRGNKSTEDQNKVWARCSELLLSVVKSSWCASVSASPFEVSFIPLAQGGVQMLACMQRLAKQR